LLAAKCIGLPWLLESSYRQTLANLEPGEDLAAIAQSLAAEMRGSSGADWALVQLYTGSLQAFHDKNQAIVLYNGLLTEDGFYQNTRSVAGPINVKQNQAALLALDLLRRHLQHKEL